MTKTDLTKLRVDLGARGYDILVGLDLLTKAGEFIAPVLKQPRTVIVTDETVAPLYLATLEAALSDAAVKSDSIVLPAGEQTKDFAHLEDLTGKILDLRVGRDTTLIALGGGVIGDLTGFAAAVTLRGLAFVQIPTTLLAQVDSSVGGKTGINTRHGKNLVGAFHQPCLVLADIGTLDTLPNREVRAGYAEVAKYGLINDPAFFSWLEDNGAALCDGDTTARIRAVAACCKAKAAIVGADERETGQRALLNLGHTFAHAFETECGYSDKLLHGEAVAVGMMMAFDLSTRLGLCPGRDTERVGAHLAATGLPFTLEGIAAPSWSADRLLDHMGQDKKVRAGQLTFILAEGIGKSFISHDVKPDAVRALLEDALAAA